MTPHRNSGPRLLLAAVALLNLLLASASAQSNGPSRNLTPPVPLGPSYGVFPAAGANPPVSIAPAPVPVPMNPPTVFFPPPGFPYDSARVVGPRPVPAPAYVVPFSGG